MTCPTCQAEHSHPNAYCPRCGTRLADASYAAWTDADIVVEGTVIKRETFSGGQARGSASEANEAEDDDQFAAAHDAVRSSTSLVVARPAPLSLPARLWRQPAVRALARAGAGALALTLGMRLLRGALARPRATSELASAALPAIRHLLDSRATRLSSASTNSEQDGEIVETFIYMRRVVRR